MSIDHKAIFALTLVSVRYRRPPIHGCSMRILSSIRFVFCEREACQSTRAQRCCSPQNSLIHTPHDEQPTLRQSVLRLQLSKGSPLSLRMRLQLGWLTRAHRGGFPQSNIFNVYIDRPRSP